MKTVKTVRVWFRFLLQRNQRYNQTAVGGGGVTSKVNYVAVTFLSKTIVHDHVILTIKWKEFFENQSQDFFPCVFDKPCHYALTHLRENMTYLSWVIRNDCYPCCQLKIQDSWNAIKDMRESWYEGKWTRDSWLGAPTWGASREGGGEGGWFDRTSYIKTPNVKNL